MATDQNPDSRRIGIAVIGMILLIVILGLGFAIVAFSLRNLA